MATPHAAPTEQHDARCVSWSSDDPTRCNCRDEQGHAQPERWAEGPMLAFDTETTGPDPETAVLVTATAIRIVPGCEPVVRSWLADPGVDIPEAAAAVHGITTEHARQHGAPLADVIAEVAAELAKAWQVFTPVVAYNASFDLTVIQRGLARAGLPLLKIGRVVDPLVLDRAVDQYRKGRRTLGAACEHYRVKLDNAHSSDADALAAARVAWWIARRYPEVGCIPLAELQVWQAEAHRRWADNFGAYLVKQGKTDDIERAWPMRAGA